MSKATKQCAQEVDEELLNDQNLLERIMDEEREENLPELTVDQWNEIYMEVTEDLNKMLAEQLIEDSKNDPYADYELNEMFSQCAAE